MRSLSDVELRAVAGGWDNTSLFVWMEEKLQPANQSVQDYEFSYGTMTYSGQGRFHAVFSGPGYFDMDGSEDLSDGDRVIGFHEMIDLDEPDPNGMDFSFANTQAVRDLLDKWRPMNS